MISAESALAIVFVCFVVVLVLWLLQVQSSKGLARALQRVSDIANIDREAKESHASYVQRTISEFERQSQVSAVQVEKSFKKASLYSCIMNHMSLPLMLLNSDFELIYANTAMHKWFSVAQGSIKIRQPSFDSEDPLGTFSLSDYVQLDSFTKGQQETIYVGDLVVLVGLDSAVEGGEIHYILSWADYTSQRSIERQMEDAISNILFGRLDNLMDVKEFPGFMKFIGVSINQIVETIRDPFRELLRVLPLIAGKNLTETMHGDYSGNYKNVQTSVNDMVSGLNIVLLGVQDYTAQIEVHTDGISKGNKGLEERISQQSENSARLSQVAGQMEQEFRKSTAKAQKASDLAYQLRNEAVEGEAVMAQAVDAMRELTVASLRISDIVTIIEGIAFQTQMLSLNAAVEAARAGEHGRGFTVVADEVRALSQRSAGAALEIKNLLEDSVNYLSQGSGLVEQTGVAFGDIATNVATMASMVQEISASGSHQLEEVEHMNRDLDQLNTSNKQNAEMSYQVGESTHLIGFAVAELVRKMASFSLNADWGAVQEEGVSAPGAVASESNNELSLDDTDYEVF
ncbi:MAG: methyl-accepting chemotaxis protein [Pseudomonadales bacterium]